MVWFKFQLFLTLPVITLITSSSPPFPSPDPSCFANNFPYRDLLVLKKIPGRYLPILTSNNLEQQNDQLENIIILIHGYRENVTFSFCTGLHSLMRRNLHHKVGIISPYFFHERILSDQWMNRDAKANFTSYNSLYWRKNASWISGSDSSDLELDSPDTLAATVAGREPATKGEEIAHSSFDMLDDLYLIITQRNLFPSLKRVTFIGFSAGGQLLNRYAWATSLNTPLDLQYHTHLQIPMRFLISNPSSWLYFNDFRPSSIDCIAPYDTGIAHQCHNFTAISPFKKSSCREINQWRYGLTSLLVNTSAGTATGAATSDPNNEYKYLQRAVKTEEDLQNHTFWYFQRDIRYIFGSTDTCNCFLKEYHNPDYCFIPPSSSSSSPSSCLLSPSSAPSLSSSAPPGTPSTAAAMSGCCQDTFPDSLNNDLSSTCGSQSQGTNRLQRGLNYLSYLKFFLHSSPLFSSSPKIKIRHAIVPFLQHDLPFFLSADIVSRWGYELDDSAEDNDKDWERDQEEEEKEQLLREEEEEAEVTITHTETLSPILLVLWWGAGGTLLLTLTFLLLLLFCGLSWRPLLPPSWLKRGGYTPIPETLTEELP
jgi:hypothetical protein